MMVEMAFDSSQDFGMANGALPQWKRELLQRRAARGRPPGAAPAPPGAAPAPPPAPPPADEQDEELRYGPGIVKRLKSRYLSLALRDAPRRRPSVLRRAASLEHLLDERPPPAPRPARAPRPASLAAPPARAPAPRRDFVKRARSVDALSRLEPCEPPAPPSPSPPPPPPPPPAVRAPPPPPPAARAPRPPRRPAPLLREAERPPADVVRAALRKFESAPARRPAAAARLPAVLRGLERGATPDREPEPRDPSPAPAPRAAPEPELELADPAPAHPAPAPPAPEPEYAAPSPPTSPPPAPSPSPPPTLPCSPVPAAGTPELANIPETIEPSAASRASPEPAAASGGADSRAVSRAALDGIARAGSSVRFAFEARAGSHLPPLAATNPVLVARRVGVIRPMPAPPRPAEPAAPAPACKEPPAVNGHSTPEPRAVSRIGAAGIERAWSGSAAAPAPGPWARAPARPRAPPPASTSVVFNFSNRKEVPDYIENDGIILRGSRRNRIKAGEPGVVVLRPEALEPDSEPEEPDEPDAAPERCAVRFLNDNVLINGRSSMPARPLRDRARAAKLKLQFDDSLTRTFEYPSETSLCEDEPASPAAAPAPLAHNTHLASAALSRYTPSKTPAAAFQLGVTRHAPAAPAPAPASARLLASAEAAAGAGAAGDAEPAHAVPCGADAARAWSDARAANTDLLF